MQPKRLKRWKTLRGLLHGFVCRRFNLNAELCAVAGPFLVVANHVTNWDPLMVAMSFPDTPLRYVASEHLFRHGFASRSLEWLVAPIPRRKAASGADTVKGILRALKEGDSVCLFAEGDACWDGLTHPVLPATGKLARMAGVPLVTYRLEGGYLSLPRWSGRRRLGRVHSAVVGVYQPEELKKMKGEEITALIDRDIYEDAFERQKTEHVRFRGEKRAEGIERGFFLCPKCGRPDGVHGNGNYVNCNCGLRLYYTEEGFFDPPEPVATLAEWERVQREALEKICAGAGGTHFADDGLTLHEIGGGHRETKLGSGALILHPDALELAGRRFALSDIDSMAMVKSNILLFTVGDSYYEIRAARPCCLRKYLMVWQYFKSNQGG